MSENFDICYKLTAVFILWKVIFLFDICFLKYEAKTIQSIKHLLANQILNRIRFARRYFLFRKILVHIAIM